MAAAPTPVNPLAGPTGRRHLVGVAQKDKEREERLAAALRENLKRRKSQSRQMSGEKEEKRES
jgi:hypothetical protein